MPTFEAIYQDYGDDVQFMMVDLASGQGETVEVGQAFVDGEGFTFPIFFDTTGQAANKYNISSIPTTIFIDSEGKIVDTHIGIIESTDLQNGIEEIS
jgi:thiol-disulfide isomerase/thioredoxin